MTTMIVWILGLAMSVSLMAIAAGGAYFTLHTFITALVSTLLALSALRDMRIAARDGDAVGCRASLGARYMTLVWLWAATAVFIIYTTVLDWSGWWQIVAGSLIAATVSAVFAGRLASGADDQRGHPMLKMARLLAYTQLLAMTGLVVIIGWSGALMQRGPEHVAYTILFFCALSLIAISWPMTQPNEQIAGASAISA